MTTKVISEVTGWVKQRDLVFETPLKLQPGNTVIDALHLINKRAHGSVMVVDDANRCVGMVRAADCEGVDRFASLESVMRSALTLDASTQPGYAGTPLADVIPVELDAAAAVFERLTDEAPDDVEAWFNRALCLAWRGRDVEAVDDLAEQGVLGRELHAAHAADDEELAAVGVGAGVGHGQGADLVATGLGQLVLEAVAGTAPAVALRIATLDDELGNDPMEAHAVVEAALRERRGRQRSQKGTPLVTP